MCAENEILKVAMFVADEAAKGRVNSEIVKKINAKEMEYVPATIYIRDGIAAGTTKLLRNEKSVIGLTNLDDQTIPNNYAFVVTGVGFKWGSHATETDPKAVVYESKYDADHAAIAHAEVAYTVGSREVFKLDANTIREAAAASRESYHNMGGVMKFVNPNDKLNIEVETADGVALGISKNFVEGKIFGYFLKPKNQ